VPFFLPSRSIRAAPRLLRFFDLTAGPVLPGPGTEPIARNRRRVSRSRDLA